MKFGHWTIISILGIFIIVAIVYFNRNISQYPVWQNLAGAFFSKGPQVSDLVMDYVKAPSNPQKKIKILIVPGHEPGYGGAEYGDLKERELNVQLSQNLFAYIARDKHFSVTIARDNLAWNADLFNYFNIHEGEIEKWRDNMKNQMNKLVGEGRVISIAGPAHSDSKVPSFVSTHLYGINKWASENKYDIVLHVHFNDNPRINGKPKFSGFAIYVPERQYSNSEASVTLAEDIYNDLIDVAKVSELDQEKDGVVEDQELVAIGKYNSLDALGILIEYAYIYEPVLQNTDSRDKYIRDMAYKTYTGLINFFESRGALVSK